MGRCGHFFRHQKVVFEAAVTQLDPGHSRVAAHGPWVQVPGVARQGAASPPQVFKIRLGRGVKDEDVFPFVHEPAKLGQVLAGGPAAVISHSPEDKARVSAGDSGDAVHDFLRRCSACFNSLRLSSPGNF